MTNESTAICILTVLLFAYIFAYRESFVSETEKASTIYNWFMSQSDPKYSNYKRDLTGSNVVEFESIVKLQKDGGLSIGQIRELL